MGFFDGIVDFVGDTVGGLVDGVIPSVGGMMDGWFGDVGSMLGQAGDFGFDLSGITSAMKDVWSGFPWKDIGDGLSSAASMAKDFAPIIAGGLSYMGQNSANTENLKIAQQVGDYQMESQRKAMDFSERMANTSWQRGVTDMKKAGINPMLSFMKGGASAPSASPTAGQGATMQNALAPAVNSALQASTTLAQVENINAQTANTNAQTRLTEAQIPKTLQDTRTSSSAEELNQATAQRIGYEIKRLVAEVDNIAARTQLTREETEKMRQEVVNAFLTGRNIEANTSNTQANTALRNLEIPKASNLAAAEGTAWKKHLAPFIDDLSKLTNSAAQVARGGRR